MKSRTPARRSQAARNQRRSSFLGKLFDTVLGRPELKTRRPLQMESLETRAMLALVGPEYPPPGLSNFFVSGASTGGQLGGRQFNYDLDTSYLASPINELYWGPTSPNTKMSLAGSGTALSFSSANIVSVTATQAIWERTDIPVDFNGDNNPDGVVTGRLTLSISGSSSPLTTTIPTGMTPNLGVSLAVTSDFSANFQFTVAGQAADLYYDNVSTGGFGSFTSFAAGFWHEGDPVLTSTPDTTPDGWNVSRSGNDTVVTRNSVEVYRYPTASLNTLTIPGTTDNDSLVIDVSGGNPIPSGGITFNGGEAAGDDDRLRIQGYNTASVTVNHTGPEAGSVVLAGLGTVNFTQIEPLALAGTAADLIINLPAGPNPDVLLGDDTLADFPDVSNVANDANTSAIDGSTFEFTQFTNPTNSLVVNLGPNGDTITVLAMDAAFNPALATNALLIQGGAAADTFNVRAAQRSGGGVYNGLTLNGGGGVDTFNVSSNAPTNTGNLDAIDSLVTVNGGGQADILNISESGSGAGDTIDFYNVGFNITGTAGGGWTVNTGGSALSGGINLTTGSGVDVVRIYNNVPSELVNINTGGGADTFQVSSDGTGVTGNLSLLDSVLTINAGSGSNTLRVSDFSAGANAAAVVSSTSITGLAPVAINYSATGGDFGGGIFVTGSNTGGDNISVPNTLASSPVTINGAGGDDTITVGNGTLDNILSTVNVNGNAHVAPPRDILIVNDSTDNTANNYAVTPTTVTRTQGSVLINYATIEVVQLNGGVAADTYNITPSTTTAMEINGNTPASFATPDVLTYSGGATPAQKDLLGPDIGTITGGPFQPVSYTGMERVSAAPGGNVFNDVIDMSALPMIALGGQDANPNQVLLRRLDDAGQTYLQVFIDFNTNDNGGVPNPVLFSSQLYASVGTIRYIGSSDVDQLVVDNANGLINRAITLNGNGPVNSGEPNGDSLSIRNTPAGGLGAASRETYVVGATEDAGTWVIDPDGSRGAGLANPGNGDEMVVTFTGLEPADTDTVVANFDVIMSASSDIVTITNGGVLNATPNSLLVTDVGGTFETFRFANKTNFRLMGEDGADQIGLDFTIPATGLTNMELYGHVAPLVPSVTTDDDSEIFDLNRSNVTTLSIFGQGGDDLVNNIGVGPLGNSSNLDNVFGTVAIDLGANIAGDEIRLQDNLDATGETVTLDQTSPTVGRLSGAAGAGAVITFTAAEAFLYEATGGADTINILATIAGTNYYVTGDGGADTITVGNTAAGFAVPGTGTLANIDGALLLTGEFNPPGPGSVDTLNVDASADAALAGAATIGINPAFNYTLPVSGATDSGAATELLNFASAPIRYRHTDSTFVPAAFSNAIEFMNVRGSLGADDITVNATTASNRTLAANSGTVIDGYLGNDNIVVNAANLSGNNSILGNDGNDNIVLNVATDIGTHTAPSLADPRFNILSLNLAGNNQAAATPGDTVNRDRVIINDTNAGFPRVLDYEFLGTQGDLDIGTPAGAGLFGANLAGGTVTVRSTETYIFNSADANDAVQVLGTAVNDVLTVALLPTTAGSGEVLANAAATPVLPGGAVANSSAIVYLNGAPYLSTPPVDLINPANQPGMSGGGLGPDLLLNGIAPAGITLDGNGNTGVVGTGDRAVVYAASEADLLDAPLNPTNIFGLGTGVLQTGFGVGDAYDTITVTDAQVTTTNNSEGPLVTVNLNTASFVQAGPADPTQNAALVVNGGDEALPQANNIADNITATISTNFNIQVNGNQPGLTLVNPADKNSERQGDQLTIVTPPGGSLNIFSDNASPVPNVSVGTTNSIYALQNTSIERLTLDAGLSGNVNLIGDNNDPAVTQNDYFRVRGRDVDGTGEGVNEMQVQLGGNWNPTTGAVDLSPPIFINNVFRLNVSGGNAIGFDAFGNAIPEVTATGTDALEITAYADNTPRGWGVETYFNEGDDGAVGDGGLAPPDLLIFNGVLGVSENIVVQPSGPLNGQVFSNNAATNTPIAVVNYMLNSHIIVNGSSPAGTIGDTDSLTLRGTNPASGSTSGNEDIVADFNATGTAITPMVRVYDAGNVFNIAGRPTAAELADTAGAAANVLYNLQNFTNFNTLNFELLAGSDVLSLIGRNDGSLTVNVDGGADSVGDGILIPGVAGAADSLQYAAGSTSNQANLLAQRSGAVAATRVNLTGVDNVSFDGGGGAGTDALAVIGTPGVDSFAVNATSAIAGEIAVGSFPALSYANLGTGTSTISLFNDSLVNGTNLDSALIRGTAGVDAYVWTPTSNTDGTLDLTTGGVTSQFALSGFGSANVDAQAGVDSITTTLTSAIINQGATSDTGTITATDAGGQGLLPLGFSNVESATVSTAAGTTIVTGTADDDVITLLATGIVTVADRSGLIIHTYDVSAANQLVINSGNGDDDIIVNAQAAVRFAAGILVIGGENGNGSDQLTLNGDAGSTAVIDMAAFQATGAGLGTVDFVGIEHLDVTNGAGDITVNGTAAPDTISVTPTGANTTLIQFAGIATTVDTDNTGVLTVDGVGGNDSVTINGTAAADTIAVIKGASTTVQVGGLKLITLPAATSETVNIAAGDGNDTINISGTTAAGQTINVQGGSPSSNALGAADTVNITLATAGATTVAPGSTPDAGVINSPDGATGFAGLEFVNVIGLVGGANTLNAQGTHDNDTLALQFLGGANRIWINDRAVVSFSNFATVNLNGLFGDDKFSVTPIGLVGVTAITVAGGDPGASDELVVNGTAGPDVVNIAPSGTTADAGTISVNVLPLITFNTVEHLIYNGVTGPDAITYVSPGPLSQVTVNVGANPDSGTITASDVVSLQTRVPVSYQNIGAGGLVDFSNTLAARNDILVVNPNNVANPSDYFLVNATGGVQIFKDPTLLVPSSVNFNTTGIAVLGLNGLAGDDGFVIPGNHPFPGIAGTPGIVIDGGSPSGSDAVAFTGSGAGAVTVDYQGSTVAEAGFAAVSLVGVELLQADTAGADLNIDASTGDDVLDITPTGLNAATARLISSSPALLASFVVNGLNIGALNVDLVSGSDRLIVNGTQAGETITVNGTTVTIPGLEVVNYTNVDDLQVKAQSGDDTIDVTPSLTTTIFIDGGDPIGSTPGDQLVLHPPAAFQVEPGPENDEGGLRGVGMARVSWDHIEGVALVGPGPAKVFGTNGDDDITVIARDASTHALADGIQDFTVTVNGSFSFLFIDQPTLFIDALAGDDDIVIRAPAPNNAIWDVDIFVAAGTPAAVTGDQGDVLLYETPGTQTINYTPTGIGMGIIDDITNSSTITIGQFICPVSLLWSSTGSVEELILDGEGGNDIVTVNGTVTDNTIVHTPGAQRDAGSFAISDVATGQAWLGLRYEDLGFAASLTVDGLGGVDTLVARGTGLSDTFTVAATTGDVTLANSGGVRIPLLQAGLEVLTLDGLEGDDNFIINGALPYANVNVNGGGPSGSDVLQINGAAAVAEAFVINPGATPGDGNYTINAGAPNVYTGIEHIFVAANAAALGDNDDLTINDDGRDNLWTVSSGTVGDLVQIAGRESIDYSGINDVVLANAFGTDRFDIYPTNVVNFTGTFTVNGDALGVVDDVLNLYGTPAADTVTSTATAVTINGSTITAGVNLIELAVITLGGADNINLDLGLAGTRKVVDAGSENDTIDMSGTLDATIFGGDGDDNIIGTPLADLIYGGTGNDIIQAGAGNDTVYAGAGNDFLIGGDGDDFLYGEEGNDTFGDLLVLAGPDGVLGTADDISTRGNNPAAPVDDAGNDFMDGGLGSDRFVWDPGDGNDTIEGGSNESDVLMFFGGAGADTFTLSQNGTRLRFDRTPGNILLDVAGVEDVRIQTLGGTDTVTINDLFATDVRHVDVNFALPDNTADGAADTIVINGREVSDVVNISSPGAGLVDVTGLKYNIRIRNAVAGANPTADDFTFNGNGGNDNVTTGDDLSAFFTSTNNPATDASRTNHFVINGGAGDDYLAGFGRLNGDTGNDTLVGSPTAAINQVIEGGAGNDTLYGGAGDDRLFGERANVAVDYAAGAGNDYLDGGLGNDFMYGGLGEDIFVGLILPGVGNGADSFLGGERLFSAAGVEAAPAADVDTDIDTILVQATAANDRIDLIQDTATQLRYNIGNQFNGNTGVVGGAGTETDTFLNSGSIDEVRVIAGAGDDTIRVTTVHALVAAGVPLNMLRFDINGGSPGASDRLTVADDGIGNTTVQRIGGIAGDGSFTQYAFAGGVPANGVIAMSPVFYTGVEYASVDPISPITGGTGTDGAGRVVVFKYDRNEQNQSLPNATHLGANATVNLEANIDPGADAIFSTPGDEDWYRVVADATGTLDFQVYFKQVGDPAANNQLSNGQAGLPGSGNLDIAVYDADGLVTGVPVAIAGTGAFGNNDATDDERVRIPAVAGQTYYLRVRGATLPAGNGVLPLSAAINSYGVTAINTPAPVPVDLELSDNYTVLSGAQVVAPNPASINATGLANFVYNAAANTFTLDLFVSGAEFQNNTIQPQVTAVQLVEGAPGVNGGAGVTQTLPLAGFVNEAGGIRLVLPATAFTLSTAQLLAGNVYLNVITTADAAPGSIPGGHIRGQINILELPENSDTGRSQFDNYTRDNTPTIFLRLDDFRNGAGLAFLADLPGAGGQATPPDETILIPFNPSTVANTNNLAPGYRIAIFDETDASNPVPLGFAQPVLNLNGVYSFTFTTPLTDGSHFISAKVQIIDPADNDTTATVVRASGFGDRSLSTEIFVDVVEPNIFFGLQQDDTDGLAPGSDTGVASDPATLEDRITSDLTPTFWGTAEADTIIRLYVDVQAPGQAGFGVVDPADFLIAQTVATPFDGTNAEPNGRWEATSTVSMNDPDLLAALIGTGSITGPLDGLRRVIATAQDVPGNVNATPAEAVELLNVFVDTQGPQVTGLRYNSLNDPFNVFDHKYEGTATLAPTPVVNSLIVRLQDLPARVAGFLYAAIQTVPNTVNPVTGAININPVLLNSGLFEVRGDHNGIIPLVSVTFTTDGNLGTLPADPLIPGTPATGYFTLTFRTAGADGQFFTADDVGAPLPDDRYTLTILDTITDPAGNALDGEANTAEPHDFPLFPSGNGTPGGNFVARFTVDTRAEVGTYSSGSAFVDINGNNKFDRDTSDFTNRDITFLYGFTSDALFAGNFSPTAGSVADGFDKLGAYGMVGNSFRWIIDTNNDGVPDINVPQPNFNGLPLNGIPVAGNFDGNAANGDEVGVFTGTQWFLDIDHDFDVTDIGGSLWVTTAQRGYPVVGNIDGLAGFGNALSGDDLVTWFNDRFYVDLASNGYGGVDETFAFGLIGVGDRPVVADMNRDGYDDLGLWQNGQSGINATDVGEFYWLLSGQVRLNSLPGAPLSGTIDSKDGVGAAVYPPPPGQVVNLSILNRIENTSVPPVNPAVNPDISVIQFTPAPFGNDLYIQYGDAFALPIVGNFDPPPTASATAPFLPSATNPRDNLDVNNDGVVNVKDAVDVIRYLRRPDSQRTVTTVSGAPFYDVTRDLNIGITDAIEVIKALRRARGQAAGEGEESVTFSQAADAIFTDLGDDGSAGL